MCTFHETGSAEKAEVEHWDFFERTTLGRHTFVVFSWLPWALMVTFEDRLIRLWRQSRNFHKIYTLRSTPPAWFCRVCLCALLRQTRRRGRNGLHGRSNSRWTRTASPVCEIRTAIRPVPTLRTQVKAKKVNMPQQPKLFPKLLQIFLNTLVAPDCCQRNDHSDNTSRFASDSFANCCTFLPADLTQGPVRARAPNLDPGETAREVGLHPDRDRGARAELAARTRVPAVAAARAPKRASLPRAFGLANKGWQLCRHVAVVVVVEERSYVSSVKLGQERLIWFLWYFGLESLWSELPTTEFRRESRPSGNCLALGKEIKLLHKQLICDVCTRLPHKIVGFIMCSFLQSVSTTNSNW